jgi:hypothetical protein
MARLDAAGWLKGRRHLLSRNDFNPQRLKKPRIATPSQYSFSDWTKNGPAKLFGEPQPPRPGVSGGGGMASDLTD